MLNSTNCSFLPSLFRGSALFLKLFMSDWPHNTNNDKPTGHPFFLPTGNGEAIRGTPIMQGPPNPTIMYSAVPYPAPMYNSRSPQLPLDPSRNKVLPKSAMSNPIFFFQPNGRLCPSDPSRMCFSEEMKENNDYYTLNPPVPQEISLPASSQSQVLSSVSEVSTGRGSAYLVPSGVFLHPFTNPVISPSANSIRPSFEMRPDFTAAQPMESVPEKGRGKKNVHSFLQFKGLRYVSYKSSSRSPFWNTMDHERERSLMATAPFAVFFQMFPWEVSNRLEILNVILRELYPSLPILGVVHNISPRSDTSFIAMISTDDLWNLIQRLRCRILMDHNGFWYADTLGQYMELKQYCEFLRYMPQRPRHAKTDGLPCMPLVVELSTAEQKREICGPSAPPSFDTIAPIRTVERHKVKKQT